MQNLENLFQKFVGDNGTNYNNQNNSNQNNTSSNNNSNFQNNRNYQGNQFNRNSSNFQNNRNYQGNQSYSNNSNNQNDRNYQGNQSYSNNSNDQNDRNYQENQFNSNNSNFQNNMNSQYNDNNQSSYQDQFSYPSSNWEPSNRNYNGSTNNQIPNMSQFGNQENSFNPSSNNYQNINYKNKDRINIYQSPEESYYNNDISSEEQQYCKPANFKKKNDDTYCYVNTEGNLVCNQKSIYCNNNYESSKCQNNDIKYGIDNRLDSALNTLLNYLNTNSNNIKKNCIPIVKKYIHEWGLQPHLQKYYNLFTRIALDDPSEKARNYFSNNALLIGLMINITNTTEESYKYNQEEESYKYPQEEESYKYNQEEESYKYNQEEESYKYNQEEESYKYNQEEESYKYNQEEESYKYPQEEMNKFQEEEMRKFQGEEINRFQEEEEILNHCKNSKFGCCPNGTTLKIDNKGTNCVVNQVSCNRSKYGCCPDNSTPKYDVQGSNCLKYPTQVKPYSPQDNSYVLNSNKNQRITYVTDTQNPREVPDNGPFNRTLYLYNENTPLPEETKECPKCPDMSNYIRKDQIPCWGCNLD